jgi:hypothetical protein
MTSMRVFPILVLVPLLGLAACGGSTKKVDPAADLALAKRVALTSADLPGYTSNPYTDSDNLPAAAKTAFATCMKVPASIFDDTPGEQKFNSPNFDKADLEVQNSVELMPKKSQADTGWNQVSEQQAPGCLKELFEAAIKTTAPDASGVTFGATSVDRFDVGVGKRSTGFGVKIAASSAGQNVTFYADVVFVQRDRAQLTFFYSGTTAPPDRTLETGLVQKVYDRVGTNAS